MTVKIVRRHVLSEYVLSMLLGLAVFTFILLLDQIFQVINIVIAKGVGIPDALTLFALMLPNVFSLSIPTSSLFGSILSYGRLSADNEITAFKTAGIKHNEYMLPPVLFSFLLACILVVYNLYVAPLAYRKFIENYFELVKSRPELKLEEKAIIKMGKNRIYFEHRDTDGSLHNISIFQFPYSAASPVASLVTASSASVNVLGNYAVFRLFSGSVQRFLIDKPDEITVMNFLRYDITIPIEQNIRHSKTLREHSPGELLGEIKTSKMNSLPSRIFETELNLRISIGLAPLFFAIIGIPLGLISHKGTKSVSFAISVGVIFLYYIFLAVGINFSDKGYLPSFFALQLPNLLAALFAVVLWLKRYEQ